MIILAQVVRVISAFFCIVADKSDDRKKILLFNGIYNLLAGIQYFLLNAFTGGLCSLLAILRNILFYKFKKKQLYFVLPIYFIILIVINLSEINSIISFLPVLLVIMYSTALFIGNTKWLKYTIITVCILEVFYDIVYSAYVGAIICILDIIFVSYSLYKLKKTKKA